jgi:predicted permease
MSNLIVILRGLARTPAFTTISILSLALGIGANTAIFSLLDPILLQRLPVRKPEELVNLYHPGPTQGSNSSDEAGGASFSYPMFRELQKEQTTLVGLGAARGSAVNLSYKNQPSIGSARLVSGNYFELLGLRPALGRLLTEDDDRTPGAHPIAVLSYPYWVTRFGSDPSVLNETIILNGYPFTIVGVVRRGFSSDRLESAPNVFIPISMKKEITPDWGDGLRDRKNYWVTLFGRLKPGMALQQSETALNATYRGQLDVDLQLLRGVDARFIERFRAKKLVLTSGSYGRGGLREFARDPLILLMSVTGLVLLICCANVANLQLARGASRSREIAVRLALGASRARLIRQLLAESCLLATAGGLLGIAVAHWTARGIHAALPAFVSLPGIGDGLDGRVLLFCLALALTTGIIFGLLPALQASNPDLVTSLKVQSGTSTSTPSSNVIRKTLVTAQVAISLFLLIGAGLFLNSLTNLNRIDLGIRVDHLLTFGVSPKSNQYTDERARTFFEQLTERLTGIPGVTMVSASVVPAVAGSSSSTTIRVEGYVPQTEGSSNCNYNEIGADYFCTMGIPLVAGREFKTSDILTAPKVAIVNEAFARFYMPGQNPLGRHIGRSGGESKPDIEIVGVVRNSTYARMREAPPRVFYIPYRQSARQRTLLIFYVRTSIEPERTAPEIRNVLAGLDPNLPIRDLKTMRVQIEENLFAERIFTILTASFAVLATVLAAIGLYGVLAYNVARRTREFGIRIALGADATCVRALIAREVLLMLAIGSAAGCAAAVGVGRFIQSILYGLESWDGTIYGLAIVLLWLVAAGAAYVPARRATSVDPIVALRYE